MLHRKMGLGIMVAIAVASTVPTPLSAGGESPPSGDYLNTSEGKVYAYSQVTQSLVFVSTCGNYTLGCDGTPPQGGSPPNDYAGNCNFLGNVWTDTWECIYIDVGLVDPFPDPAYYTINGGRVWAREVRWPVPLSGASYTVEGRWWVRDDGGSIVAQTSNDWDGPFGLSTCLQSVVQYVVTYCNESDAMGWNLPGYQEIPEAVSSHKEFCAWFKLREGGAVIWATETVCVQNTMP